MNFRNATYCMLPAIKYIFLGPNVRSMVAQEGGVTASARTTAKGTVVLSVILLKSVAKIA